MAALVTPQVGQGIPNSLKNGHPILKYVIIKINRHITAK
jgi:hypothetical protein